MPRSRTHLFRTLLMMVTLLGAAACKAQPPETPETDIQAVEAKLKATFPNFQYAEIEPAEIPGLYAVISDGTILYYAPDQELLVFGEIYDTEGHSLTQERIGELVSASTADIDRNAALTIGSGELEVISFVDPDCGYCARAAQWFAGQEYSHITRRIYFMPMANRPQARARVLGALCAPEEQRASVYLSIFDRDATPAETAGCVGAEERLAIHAAESRKAGVQGTPTFLVGGEIVAGFDQQRLTKLLSQN